MTKRNDLLASVCILTLITGSPALSDPASTKILEEYFGILKSTPVELNIGDKESKSKSTQWNNITLKSNDGAAQIAIPWILVRKKLLGGYEMTVAKQIDGIFQSPDPDIIEPVNFTIISKDMVVAVGGKEGARQYDSTFGEMLFQTQGNNLINISAKMTGGSSTQLTEPGDMGRTTGSFDIKETVIDYSLQIEDQAMSTSTTIQGFSGDFEIPIYEDFDPENPTVFFDASRNMGFTYSAASGDSKVSMVSALGPIEVNTTFGAGAGKFGITDSVAMVSGEIKDISYEISAAAMGFPPMQITLSEAVVKLGIPLDNVDESKPASYKIALSELKLSEQVWNMFDPKALLPRDAIELDIDLVASLRWLEKIADINVETAGDTPPITVETAQIKAFNLKIAGAELQTSGAVLIDNSQFPPVPDGTVDISLKGAYGLLGKLTELGLVPAQNAMMVQGMAGMFFKPGDGDDHLTSTITMTKDGHITANGMPLK